MEYKTEVGLKLSLSNRVKEKNIVFDKKQSATFPQFRSHPCKSIQLEINLAPLLKDNKNLTSRAWKHDPLNFSYLNH